MNARDREETTMTDDKKTLVEEGTEFRGTMTSTCPVVVRGKIEGELSTPSLTVSDSGAVHGKAKVGTLVSKGELSGEFDSDTVELSGRVKDGTVIRAKTLSVELSASATPKMQATFGEVSLEVGDDPRAEAAPVEGGSSGKKKKGGGGGEG
jgi:cytoskeletal protein CcmA (bactofilin family)